MLLVTGKVTTEVLEPLMIGMEKLEDIPIPAGVLALSVTGPENPRIDPTVTVKPN